VEFFHDPVRVAHERRVLRARQLDELRTRDRIRDEPNLVDGLHAVVDPVHHEHRHVDGP
jgi:hypothetical protein